MIVIVVDVLVTVLHIYLQTAVNETDQIIGKQ